MKKLCILALVCLIAITGAFAQGSGEVYPSRDITNVMVWGAGGGTDLANRLVMAEMGKILNVNINVNNVTGGVGGSIGLFEAYGREADGYTLVGVSESCVTSSVQGGFDKRMNVWDFFIIGGSPDVLSVTPNAPFNTIVELVEYCKAHPGEVRIGGSAAGSIHHLNVLGFCNGAGIEMNFIPYDSSAGSQNAAMTGEVTCVITSVQEQAELLKAGKLRPLGMMTPNEFEFEGKTIPSAFDFYPALADYLPLEQQIGFAIRKDAPESVKATLQDAFTKAMATEAVQNYGRDRYFTLKGLYGEEANKIFDNLEATFCWTLWDLGAAKIEPSKFGIERP
ncbi:MAG: tripartite tricarboxylate transporter substrate binding protein [Spirochaetales bacterium]|nr:tripartite tricarboxylate transporter substrate binding protein [Spirochaetales bacterium]